MENLVVTCSPHARSGETTRKIMMKVLIALLPAGAFSVYFFGIRALYLILICAICSPLFEMLWCWLIKRPDSTDDLSAVVTGVLLAYNLPVSIPIWEAVAGCFFAIIVIKEFFGGIGQNFINPAIGGRVFLLISFATRMTDWTVYEGTKAADYLSAVSSVTSDAVSSATPLRSDTANFYDLLFGRTGGSLGETCALVLIAGGILLMAMKVISPIIPLTYIGTAAAVAWLCGENPIYHIFAGGLMLGAIFMATDYVTSPATNKGKFIFAIGCGVITMLIRIYGNYPEGVSFAILLMNIVTPLIDRATMTRPFGALVPAKGGDAK
ncbi:MAG TPA: RnfABCDGE type electron transport complex subunit D [Oscillospiraceae bacterium]|nr:RnfABCDGE type electron transport complex subunit D [Oscillospiraceae bacterium]